MSAPCKDKRIALTIRLTPEMNEKLTEVTRKMGVSKNAYIKMLLTNALQEFEKLAWSLHSKECKQR